MEEVTKSIPNAKSRGSRQNQGTQNNYQGTFPTFPIQISLCDQKSSLVQTQLLALFLKFWLLKSPSSSFFILHQNPLKSKFNSFCLGGTNFAEFQQFKEEEAIILELNEFNQLRVETKNGRQLTNFKPLPQPITTNFMSSPSGRNGEPHFLYSMDIENSEATIIFSNKNCDRFEKEIKKNQ